MNSTNISNEHLSNYVGGMFLKSKNINASLEVKNKYNSQVIGTYNEISNTEDYTFVIEKMQSFTSSFSHLSMSAEDRSHYLNEIYYKLKAQHLFFSKLISEEAGKPISYAKGEVERCLSTILLGAREALNQTGNVVAMTSKINKTIASTKNEYQLEAYYKFFPKGPIFAIAPFNFPLNLALHKIVPAIAIGAPIVIKPSPYSPRTLLEFAKLIDQTSLPKGLVNIVACDHKIAQMFVESNFFKVFSFTGSPKIGWHLKAMAGKKKVLLELGGNAAVIVEKDCDLAEAAKKCAIGAFLYAGQICISTQRIFINEKVYEDFKKLLIEEVKNINVGDPSDENVQVGPIIDEIHLDRIDQWVNQAVDFGAKIVIGGKIISKEHNLYAPTVLENASADSKVNCEEIFGPVVTLKSFSKFSDAINLVNDSRFGLQVGIFSNDLKQMKEAFNELEVGAVLMNSIPGFRLDQMPYGGVKDSGIGREGVSYTMEEYCEKKLLIY